MPRNRLPYLVGLTGFSGAGKDVAAAGLVAAGWTRQAFADPVRSMALAIDPWVTCPTFSYSPVRLSLLVDERGWWYAKQAPDVREFLQRLGTDAVRAHLGDDAWVRAFEHARDRLWPADIVAPDVRFDNEAAYIVRNGGMMIRIDRPGVGPVNTHASEDIGGIPVDEIVVNDGTPEQLQARVLELVDRHYRTPVAGLPF